MMPRPTSARRPPLGLLLLLALLSPLQAADERSEAPRSDLVEETAVRLLLLDVEVHDDQGLPLRGLSAQDFRVLLDGKEWPIYSVDESCDCPESVDAGAADEAHDRSRAESRSVRPARLRYVMYFDFSQLQIRGRERAIAQARRWLETRWAPQHEVLLAAYSTAAGLEELTGFTADRDELLRVLEQMREDPELVDPFPSNRGNRIRQCLDCCARECDIDGGCGWCDLGIPCGECCPICNDNASREYFHGRRSMKSLQRLLVRLQAKPGRKALLLFHQNGGLFPGRLYPVSRNRIPDNVMLLDELAAEATLGRARIFAANTGARSDEPPGGFAELARLTGGAHNRDAADLGRLLDGVGRGCACTYRIGLEPPGDSAGRVHRVRIEARGLPLSGDRRVRVLTGLDRWMRAAQDVLLEPERHGALGVSAAVVPIRATRAGWQVAVQVSLDLDALLLLPGDGERAGGWEVGAMLSRDEGLRSWELLGVATLRADGDHRPGRAVLHQHLLGKLKPGRYELAAFVRDSTSNLFGGAAARIRLPRRDGGHLAGPVVLWSSREHLRAPLPVWSKKSRSVVRVSEVQRGPLPFDPAAAASGESVALLTLVCSRGRRSPAKDLVRFVSSGGKPLFRLEPAALEEAGSCARLVDEVETWRLAPGRYRYHVRLQSDGATLEEATADFAVEPPRPADEPTELSPDRAAGGPGSPRRGPPPGPAAPGPAERSDTPPGGR